MTEAEILKLIHNHDESEILEYKTNLKDAESIGRYVSALGNSAILTHNPAAYLIWGVEDISKKVVGTSFNPNLAKAIKKKGSVHNQMPLETYLEKMVDPRINLKFETVEIYDHKLVVLTIDISHITRPIKFHGSKFIRSGSSTTSLDDFPEKERLIWLAFESSKFELEFAKTNLTFGAVQDLLALQYYSKQKAMIDNNNDSLIQELINDNIIVESNGMFNITNLGAYTLSKDINAFPALKGRTLRITQYNGSQNISNAVYDHTGNFGIAIAFNNIIKAIMRLLPYSEDYSSGQRKDIPMFPQLAIRELVANALVHQDFTVTGSRPTVEIYDTRIEISNPGTPLIEPKRFLDFKPKSRNDELANLLGKFHIVESRGTGIDKVVNSLEEFGLPAMDIRTQSSETTVITLHAKKKFQDMPITEKVQSIYWNACLRYVGGQQINNASLRTSFHLTNNGTKEVSKALASALNAKLIKPFDPNSGKKFMKYIPYWGTDILGS